MQTKAVLRYARISPQKCRLVVDTIRGKSATLAVNTLKFMPKKGAKIVLKVLDSAIANAYNNFNADVDDLKVTRIEVDPAPMLKRFHARAKGRGVRIAKRNSHILVQVSDGKRRGLMGQKVNPVAHGIRSGDHPRLVVEVVCAFRRTSPRTSTPTSWCASFSTRSWRMRRC